MAATSARVAKDRVAAWETTAFRGLNGMPGIIGPIVWAPMQAGALGTPLVVSAALFAQGKNEPAARLATAGIVAWGAAKVVKSVVGRSRPAAHLEETHLRIGSAGHGLGFPSGHAAVATAVGISLAEQIRSGGSLVAIAVPSVVGFSRMYVGAHYPLDVVGGLGLGLAASCSTQLLAIAVAAIRRGSQSPKP